MSIYSRPSVTGEEPCNKQSAKSVSEMRQCVIEDTWSWPGQPLREDQSKDEIREGHRGFTVVYSGGLCISSTGFLREAIIDTVH